MMIKISVVFTFSKKEEGIDFVQKLQMKKEFLKYTEGSDIILAKFKTFENYIEFMFKHTTFALLSLSTRSGKTLSKLNDWIKENHYESNYALWRSMGKMQIWKMHMSLDQLFDEFGCC
jgi:hypothetical protein